MQIRKIKPFDKLWIDNLFIREWGSTKIVTQGKLYDVNDLLGFIAEIGIKRVGFITYRIDHDECEVISLNSLKSGLGIGKVLLSEVIEQARNNNCKRVWLITTNDNRKAQKFYEHLGWELVKIHKNAIAISRKLKPEIPLLGFNDIPIRDEFKYELILS
ncbi:GNAT family N-acetyltransferase [Candidatus Cloacimonadota bacterium]